MTRPILAFAILPLCLLFTITQSATPTAPTPEEVVREIPGPKY